MTDEEIDKALDQAGGPMPTQKLDTAGSAALHPSLANTALQYAAHKVGLVADGLGAGIVNTLGMAGDAEQQVNKWLPASMQATNANGLSDYLNLKGNYTLPTSQMLRSATGAGSYVKPEGVGEELLKSGAEGLPSGVIGMGLGMGPLQAIRAGVGMGLGQKLGSYLDPYTGGWGSTVGAILGGGISGIGGARASTSKVAPIVEGLGANSSNWQQAGEAMRGAMADLSDQYTPEAKAAYLATEGRAPNSSPYLNTLTLPEIEARKWREVGEGAKGTVVDMTKPADAIQSALDARGSVSSAVNPNAGFLQKWQKAVLDKPAQEFDANGKAIPLPPMDEWLPKVTSWDDAGGGREILSEMLRRDPNNADLGAVHDAFTDALRSSVPAKVASKLDEADSATIDAQEYHKKIIDPVLGRPGASGPAPAANPGALAKKLVMGGKEDSNNLENIFNQMPGLRPEFASALLNENPQLWTKLNPQSQAALIPDEGLRARLSEAVGADAQMPKAGPTSGPAVETAHGVSGLRGKEAIDALWHTGRGIASGDPLATVHGGLELAALSGFRPQSVAKGTKAMVPGMAVGSANALGAENVEK